MFKIIAWNLSGLTIISLFLSQLTSERDSSSNANTKLYNLSKLGMSDLVNHESDSFSHILKKIGPNVDGCGTSKKKNVKHATSIISFHVFFSFFSGKY